MGKVTLKGHIGVPGRQLEAVKTALTEHIRLTREEPGCLVFEVVQRVNEPLVFDVFEEFVDQTAFDSHQNRVSSSAWGEATRDVERHYQISTEEP